MSGQSNAGWKAYHQAAAEFIEEIQQVCPLAAACLKQIQAQYGARAAYLAAFALANLKLRQTALGHHPDRDELLRYTYYDEMQESEGAVELYQEAAEHLFPPSPGSDAGAAT